MSVRLQLTHEMLNTRQRLTLFHGTSVSAERALLLKDTEITKDFLISNGVSARNLTAAGVGPVLLKQMGVQSAHELRDMCFDALHLSDSKFASEANASYGSIAVVETFLCSASDAVAIAGTEAMSILGIRGQELLEACAGAPTEAVAVLMQLPPGKALKDISPTTLLDSGIRKNMLMHLGYSLPLVVAQTGATHDSLQKLGFGF
jgi:hypothetical protein